MCMHVCVYIYCCLCICLCVPLEWSTHRQRSCVQVQLPLPTIVLRLVAPFPGSSHLPTLLLFVVFQNWKKQRQLVGSTANPQDRLFSSRRRWSTSAQLGSRPEGAVTQDTLPGLLEEGHQGQAHEAHSCQGQTGLKGLRSFPLWNPVCAHTETHVWVLLPE
jgi:hypothetical protein